MLQGQSHFFIYATSLNLLAMLGKITFPLLEPDLEKVVNLCCKQ